MNRGEVWWVNLDTSVGGEIQKKRPAVIISNDRANKHLNRVQVVPLTSSVEKLYPAEVYVNFGGKRGKALPSQIATVSKLRMLNRAGRISKRDFEEIERGVMIQLGLREK
jgi:mRNA interferase MazF